MTENVIGALPFAQRVEDTAEWSSDDWSRWLTDRTQVYHGVSRQRGDDTLFYPFVVNLPHSPQRYGIPEQILQQISRYAAHVMPVAAAGARDAAMRWALEDGTASGLFFIEMAGLCDAENLPEMLRAIDEKFPLWMKGQKLESVFASISNHVLDKMTSDEIADFREHVLKRRGDDSPQAFMERTARHARPAQNKTIPPAELKS